MYERMGLVFVDAEAGRVEQPRTAYVANSIGTINGGAQAVVIQAAAEAMCPGRAAVDMELHYLSQVKAGPARTVAKVLREVEDHSVVDVRLLDAGNDDQLLTIATVTLRGRPC
jgi:acyl-coenzyme A thioesterase PaaI-like protein